MQAHSKMPKRILLLDVFNILHRAFHAIPKTFSDKEGNPTNAIYGVSSMLLNVFESVSPSYAVAALESRGPTKRAQAFSEYKAQRKPLDEMLEAQIPGVLEVVEAFGARAISVEGYEADDVIGTMTSKYRDNHEFEVLIVSNDRDLWQLAGSNIFYLLPSTKGNGVEWLGKKEIEARLGFSHDLLVDYKGLRGDPSDNIAGVAGIGEVTAKKLISEFGRLDDIYSALSEVRPAAVQKKLEESRQVAFDSRELATIVTDLDLKTTLSDCKYSAFNKMRVKELFERRNFKSLLKKLGFESPQQSGSKSAAAPDPAQTSLFV